MTKATPLHVSAEPDEPTDAQVTEAVAAWRKANRFMSIENAMRAALRAAFQEGSNRG